MVLRYYKKDDYKKFCEFWKEHNHKIIKEEMLSPVGIVVEENGIIKGGTWLYVMNGCDVVQIAWTTLNPEIKIKDKFITLELLHEGIMQTCNKLKKTNLVMFCDKTGLNKFFTKRGYQVYATYSLLMGSL